MFLADVLFWIHARTLLRQPDKGQIGRPPYVVVVRIPGMTSAVMGSYLARKAYCRFLMPRII